MPISNKVAGLLLLSVLFTIGGCKKNKEEVTYQYQVNTVSVLPNNISKTRMKTNDQFVAILYANLFQKALSANQIFQISQCLESVGDQILARQLIIANFMGKSGVIMPTDTEMRNDIPKFVEETYVKFFVRRPTEAEKEYLKQMIIADPKITAELVYFSFALSDEYMYY